MFKKYMSVVVRCLCSYSLFYYLYCNLGLFLTLPRLHFGCFSCTIKIFANHFSPPAVQVFTSNSTLIQLISNNKISKDWFKYMICARICVHYLALSFCPFTFTEFSRWPYRSTLLSLSKIYPCLSAVGLRRRFKIILEIITMVVHTHFPFMSLFLQPLCDLPYIALTHSYVTD